MLGGYIVNQKDPKNLTGKIFNTKENTVSKYDDLTIIDSSTNKSNYYEKMATLKEKSFIPLTENEYYYNNFNNIK